MSFASLNGQRIISGSITIPYYGIWAGDVTLAVASPMPNPVTLVIGDLTLAGFIYRSASFTASRSARVVGGFGGWRKSIGAQSYQNNAGVTMSMVLKDAAATVGEKVNVPNDQALGTSYVREAAPAERLLRQMAGPEWYIDPSGVTQVGALRPTGRITSPYNVIDWSGAKGRFEIATENYADWLPGRSFQNVNISVPQAVGMTTFNMENDGTLRLFVLSSGAADV